MDDVNVVGQPPQDAPPQEDRTEKIIWGCVSAVVVAAIMICVGGAGITWTAMQLPDLAGELGLPVFIIVAGLYGGLLLLIFGAAAVFLTGKSFALWRGMALSLAVFGGYTLVQGLILSINHAGRFPTLPHWLLPAVSILFSGAVIALARRKFLVRPDPMLLVFSAGLGLLISVGWLWVGTLGDMVEIALSALDALSTALIAAVLLRLITFFDDDFTARRPIWSALLTGAMFAGLTAGLMAVRGYALQGNTLVGALLLAGVVAGVLMTLGNGGWWSVFAFLFALLLIPLNWTEGFEGDYMWTDLGPAWQPAILSSLAITLVVSITLLLARKWLATYAARPAVAISVVGWSMLMCVVVALSMGRPGVQPQTFFVVLKDEANTRDALSIKDLEKRKQTVYDTLVAHADQSQAGLRQMLDAGGVTYRVYYLVNGIEVDGNPVLRAKIEARPDVAYVLDSPHARTLPSFTQGMELSGFQMTPDEPGWNIQEMNVPQVWEEYGVSGEGVVIGSADTGVDWQHPTLRSQYLGSAGDHNYTWYDPWYGRTAPDDVMGHGTHTTGTIVGIGGIGVAPSAKWIACRNLGRNLGNPAVYLDCMQFLFAPFPMDGDPLRDGDPSRGADVVNNSWGCPPPEGCDANTLSVAVEHLYHAGQLYVISAGNDGPDCSTIDSPGNAEYAISVGAIAPGGDITAFSSRGPITNDGSGRIKPDVVAPGSEILSSVPGGGFDYLQGTSMAGPHVVGLVALLWSADPSLKGNIDRTREIIEGTAHTQTASAKCGAASGDENNVYGFGMIDALAAVEEALDSSGK